MWIIGYTTREHLLLDLDETTEAKAIRIAQLIQQSWPAVGDCLVLESSTPTKVTYLKYDDKGVPHELWVHQNYHLVFDNNIGYDRCCEVIDCLVDLNVLQPEYKQIRMFRGDMTLRVSPKWLINRTVPPPKIVDWAWNTKTKQEDYMIDVYLKFMLAAEHALKRVHVSTPTTQRIDRPPQQAQPTQF